MKEPVIAQYLRVSSDEQRERHTVESQLDFGKRYEQLHGIKITHRYIDDGISSLVPFKERPDGRRALADARAGKFDVLLTFNFYRMFGNQLDLHATLDEFDEIGVQVRSMTEAMPDEADPSTTNVMRGMYGIMAQARLDNLRFSVMAGHYKWAAAGYWQGGKPPFGYKIVHDQAQGRPRLEIDEEQASIVREIFLLYISGVSTRKVADKLNERDVPHPLQWNTRAKARPWYDSTISRMIRDPIYKGEATYRKTVGQSRRGRVISRQPAERQKQVPFQVAPIVSPETWEKAQIVRVNNQKFSPRNERHPYLLSGLIRCMGCQLEGHKRTYIGTSSRRGDKTWYYYVCRSQSRGRALESCGTPAVRAEEVEQSVWAQLKLFANNPGSLKAYFKKKLEERELVKKDSAEESERVRKQILAKAAGRARVINLARTGIINEAEAEKELRDLQKELDGLEERLAELSGRHYQAELVEARIKDAESALAAVAPEMDRMEPGERRELVRRWVTEIRVSAVERNGKKMPRVEIEYLVPRPNPRESSGVNVTDCDEDGCSSSALSVTFQRQLYIEDKRAQNGRPERRYITFRGKTQSLTEWARETGISLYTIRGRLEAGWPVRKALYTPVTKTKRWPDPDSS